MRIGPSILSFLKAYPFSTGICGLSVVVALIILKVLTSSANTEYPFGPDAEKLTALLRTIDPQLAIFLRVDDGLDSGEAAVRVTTGWRFQDYLRRHQAAQQVEQFWVRIRELRSNNRPRVRFVDFNGKEVGGSGNFGVWVQKE